MMQTPFPAYRGDENYIFVSYAHKDTDNVFPAIRALKKAGCRIWYDEGIEAGEDWSGTIAGHLKKASAVLYFMSRNTAGRENVERELTYASQNDIPVLVVMLGKFRLTPQQEKQITVNQYLHLDAYKTYGEFVAAALPALGKYEVLDPDATEGTAQKSGKTERIVLRDENRKKIIRTVCLAAAIVLAVLLVFGLLFKKVPSVRGMKTKDAEQAVADAGFKPTVSLNYSDEFEYGTVFQQSAEGILLKLIPVVITQSLGPEENLTDVPDVVGTEISEGARLLIEAGLRKFTVLPEFESGFAIGNISEQSIPAGLRVSKNNVMDLSVKTDGGAYTFTVEGRTYTLSGDTPVVVDADEAVPEKETQEEIVPEETPEEQDMALSPDRPEDFQMTVAEWELFRQNNKHSIWNPQDYENVWLPAALSSTVAEHPGECYGWVIVRDMELDASELFSGYSEIYVCPGVTVTVHGKVVDTDANNDYYVAPGGKLVFDDEVNGGVHLVNDGTTEFRKNLKGGNDGVVIGNRGNIEVNGSVGTGVNLWSFYGSSFTGTDETGGTLHDYSPYRQVTATNWYEGCSGENGFGMIIGKLETFASYPQDEDHNEEFWITPVIKPEDYEDHYKEEFYTACYLFLNDYTVDRFRHGRGVYWQFIVPDGITLTIDTPENDQHVAVVNEKGGTTIINSDIRGYYPYAVYVVNDGTFILNGNYVVEEGYQGELLMNRGTFIANGTFGGPKMYVFNFPGSSFTGNIREDTYIANIDWTPEYVTYGNGPESAIRYQQDVLAREYGYKNWLE